MEIGERLAGMGLVPCWGPPADEEVQGPQPASPAAWQLDDDHLLARLQVAQQLAASTHADWLGLLAEVERREASLRVHGVPTASWLAGGTSHSARAAKADVHLAGLVADLPPVADALASGRLSVEQAAVICRGLEPLAELDSAQRLAVADHLVELAREFNPTALRSLVGRAVEVVAPEVADAADAAALRRAERSQERTRHVAWRRDHDGGLLISGKLTALQGEAFKAHLSALARHQVAVDSVNGVDTSQAQALADALALVVDHHSTCVGGPVRGGDAVRVVVALAMESLADAVGSATLVGSGERLTAGQVRHVACTAGIVPLVLGGESQPLDVGRAQRLFSSGQRTALAHRDGGCSFPGCERPPSDCEAHHVVPWWAGGPTDLSNGVLLCPHHHHLVEPRPDRPPEQGWTITFDARGRPAFTGPARRGGIRSTRQHHRFRS